jgi:hypothetical protein
MRLLVNKSSLFTPLTFSVAVADSFILFITSDPLRLRTDTVLICKCYIKYKNLSSINIDINFLEQNIRHGQRHVMLYTFSSILALMPLK